LFGTHGYIAPELFAGHLPDPRSDLYSVGALMYEILTSLPVTDLSNAPELLAIAPPRVVAPGADIPEAVEDVVMQALSDIEARFQSATAMVTAIREALAPVTVAVPVEVEAPTGPHHHRRAAGRHRVDPRHALSVGRPEAPAPAVAHRRDRRSPARRPAAPGPRGGRDRRPHGRRLAPAATFVASATSTGPLPSSSPPEELKVSTFGNPAAPGWE
jgi:serine/threonine protein kinase